MMKLLGLIIVFTVQHTLINIVLKLQMIVRFLIKFKNANIKGSVNISISLLTIVTFIIMVGMSAVVVVVWINKSNIFNNKNEDSKIVLVFVYPETINTRASFHFAWRSISLVK